MITPRPMVISALVGAFILQPLTAAETTPKTEWMFVEEGPRPGLSNPLLAEGMVVVGSDAGTVWAFDAITGNEKWRHSHGARIYDRPEFDNQHVYVISFEHGAEALDRRDGRLVWSQSPKQGFGAMAVAPDAGLLFLCGYDGVVRAHDALTGAEKWATSIVKDAPADPPGFDGNRARLQSTVARPTAALCAGRCVYVSIFDQSRVVGFDIVDGTKKFDYQAGGWILPAPLVDGDDVFIGSQDQSLHRVDRVTSKVVWSFRTQSRIESSAAVDGDKVYFGACDGGFYCIDRTSGDAKWRFEIETDSERTKAIYSDPLIFDDTICFAAGEGQVYALDLVSGALRWKHRPVEDSELFTSPASHGRLIFLTSRPRFNNMGKATAGRAALIAIDPYFEIVDPFAPNSTD